MGNFQAIYLFTSINELFSFAQCPSGSKTVFTRDCVSANKDPFNHNIRFQKYKLKMLLHPPPPVGVITSIRVCVCVGGVKLDQLWFVKQQVELSASFRPAS